MPDSLCHACDWSDPLLGVALALFMLALFAGAAAVLMRGPKE